MNKYKYMKIGIASSEEILSWINPELRGKNYVYNPKKKDRVTLLDEDGNPLLDEAGKPIEFKLKGEVKNAETINYRTLKPEKDGLFCEVIFGPQKSNTCACGKQVPHDPSVRKFCEKCGVEYTDSKVRRERMGYIALNAPVVHTWFLHNTPSKIATLLEWTSKELEEVVYFQKYVVTWVKEGYSQFKLGQRISNQEYSYYRSVDRGSFKASTGAEIIKQILHDLDLRSLKETIRTKIHDKKTPKQEKEKLVKRLDIVEAFLQSDNKPEWMVMDIIPVLPPDLRPMVQIDGGRFATTDLNDLYRKIIQSNIRLQNEINLKMPQQIIIQEERQLQDKVDHLIDNSKRNKRVAVSNNHPLKSLSDNLRGKQGRFRQNLLGKRVDYSGRSVICVGPFLKMYQCGIPYEMALILFEPFIISYMVNHQKEEEQVQYDASGNVITQPIKEKTGIRKARELIRRGDPKAMDALEKIIVEHPVLLNRAPTLHRLSIQAFEPVLVQGKAIRLHPLVTTPFNADFDGDQMPVHVPLSEEAQAEARMLMLASKNILAPKDGKPVITPTQDMIIGNYYLTIEKHQNDLVYETYEELKAAYKARRFEFDNRILVNDEIEYRTFEELSKDVEILNTLSPVGKFLVVGREGKAFKDISEVEKAYENHDIDFHTRFVMPAKSIGKPFVVMNPLDKDYDEKVKLNEQLMDKYIVTTYGKLIFNQVFPNDFVFFNSPQIEDGNVKESAKYNLRYGTPKRFFLERGTNYKEAIHNMPLNGPANKKTLSLIIAEVFRQCKLAETSLTLDKMKDLGFYYSTMSGLTVSLFDVRIIEEKQQILDEADERVKEINRLYRRGRLTKKERIDTSVAIWEAAKKDIEDRIKSIIKEEADINDIFLMADSGARGSSSNFVQLAGIRGIMKKPNGESMEIPVKTCLYEGMSMSDFFLSTHGSRKGSTDTALKTAESGYLTRRLVDVSQDITITIDDCGTDKGMIVKTLYKKENGDTSKDNVLVPLRERIEGRFASKPVFAKLDGRKTKLVDRNELITGDIADKIIAAGVEEVEIRTNLTCISPVGVCVKCYGSDLSTTGLVEKGEVVGIVAAQSIGEPGTQLTMRTFHSGGVASGSEDITEGLPRVQELFEARPPKSQAEISVMTGVVKAITEDPDTSLKTIVLENERETKEIHPDHGRQILVKVGDQVKIGQKLTDGAINVKNLLIYSGVDEVEKYILREIQSAYRTAAAVEISDKHVEIIIKQMLQKVIVIDSGDTELLPGSLISKSDLYRILKDCVNKGLRIPAVKPIVLGITRASLKNDSFLAAASFQETTRVLSEAAIRGKIDYLDGLKENIIIGGLIPAGTGLVEHVSYEAEDPDVTYDLRKF